MENINLVTLLDRYNTDDRCRDALEAIRWPSGVACLRCGDTSVSEITTRHVWACGGCGYRFSVTAGTIMHRSHLPLRKWFLAIYLMGRENRLEYRTCVAGAIERGGQVRIERIPDAKKGTIQGFVERTVSPEAEAIYTDELRSSIGVETDTRRYEPGTPTTSGWSAMSTRTAWRASGASSSGPSSAASTR